MTSSIIRERVYPKPLTPVNCPSRGERASFLSASRRPATARRQAYKERLSVPALKINEWATVIMASLLIIGAASFFIYAMVKDKSIPVSPPMAKAGTVLNGPGIRSGLSLVPQYDAYTVAMMGIATFGAIFIFLCIIMRTMTKAKVTISGRGKTCLK